MQSGCNNAEIYPRSRAQQHQPHRRYCSQHVHPPAPENDGKSINSGSSDFYPPADAKRWYKLVFVGSLQPRGRQGPETVQQSICQEDRGGGIQRPLSLHRDTSQEMIKLGSSGTFTVSAATADAFLTFWPLRFSIFISINLSLGFFLSSFSDLKCSGSSAVRDEGLTHRENSFLEDSIKFQQPRCRLSRAKWMGGLGSGAGQVGLS